jgi:hypothetical protein|tara:strand:+ start:230 stop:625 length:396 start_codon:yes stop_codon:yes gene_type:complete
MDEIINTELNFNFVYAKDALSIKKYLNTVEEGDKINYIDIVNKLTKNDYYQYEPSDAVVSSYLIKQLQSSIENIKVDKVYYVLSQLDKQIITNIKEYVLDWADRPITFNVHYTEDINLNGTAELFEGRTIF